MYKIFKLDITSQKNHFLNVNKKKLQTEGFEELFKVIKDEFEKYLIQESFLL